MMANEWQLLEFILPGRGGVISAWTSEMDSRTRAAFDAKLAVLHRYTDNDFTREVKPMENTGEGDCTGLNSIGFKSSVQHRILGFHIGERRRFAMVLHAFHKDRQWTPKGFCRIAQERKAGAIADPSKLRVFPWP